MRNYCLKRFLFSILFIFFSCYLLSAQSGLQLKFKRSLVYAGIEVGSKGVKMSLIEMNKNTRQNLNYNIVGDTSINTNFISFTPATFQASLNALYDLYQTALVFYKIPPARIYTVISSGVKVSAQKDGKAKLIQTLIDSFKIEIHEPNRKVEIINPEEEARLSHLGIIPEHLGKFPVIID